MARKRKRNAAAPGLVPDSTAETSARDTAEVDTAEVETAEVETAEAGEVGAALKTDHAETAEAPDGPEEHQAIEPDAVAAQEAVAPQESQSVEPVGPQGPEPVEQVGDEAEPVEPVPPQEPEAPEPVGDEAERVDPAPPQEPEAPEPVADKAEPQPVVSREPEPVAVAPHEPEAPEPAEAAEAAEPVSDNAEPHPVVSREPEPVEPVVPVEPIAHDVDEPEAPSTPLASATVGLGAAARDGSVRAEPSTEPSEPSTEPGMTEDASTAAYEGASVPGASGTAEEPGPPSDDRGPVEGWAAWRRLLLMGRPRSTKANLLGALLAIALGIGIGTQVQLTNQRGLSELSQSDLVRVLDDISLRSSRLDDQIRELEATRDRLKNGTGSTAEALAQAQKRVDTLGILAGTVGAQGPGIGLTISDPDKKVSGPLILDLIQELRDAGAEAIDVGGVRVVGSSFVGDSDGTILIDGTEVPRPIMIKAIGDPKTLSSAMTIPGGIVETVRQKGAKATVTELGSTEITSLHSAPEPTNATPSQ